MQLIKEDDLVKRLQSETSKEQAFRELLTLYKERLYWHIRKIVISHDDTDDVLQNTFIKVFKSIDKFKGESKLFSWLYRIATNEAITHINKNAKQSNMVTKSLNPMPLTIYNLMFILKETKFN